MCGRALARALKKTALKASRRVVNALNSDECRSDVACHVCRNLL